MHWALISCGSALLTSLITYKDNKTTTTFLLLFSTVYVCILYVIALLLGKTGEIVTPGILFPNLAVYAGVLYFAYRAYKERSRERE